MGWERPEEAADFWIEAAVHGSKPPGHGSTQIAVVQAVGRDVRPTASPRRCAGNTAASAAVAAAWRVAGREEETRETTVDRIVARVSYRATGAEYLIGVGVS